MKEVNNLYPDKQPCHDNFLGYRGKVTVKTIQNNQVVAQQVYKNKGLPAFFKNICEIMTRPSSAQLNVPRYLRLYTFNKPNSSAELKKEELTEPANIVKAAEWLSSTWAALNSGPLVPASVLLPIDIRLSHTFENSTESTNKEAPKNVVSLQWNVKSSSITSDYIYVMALFPGKVSSASSEAELTKEALAYYKLVEDTKELDTAVTWQPITINKSIYDFSILVEWQLEFDNANNFETNGGIN
jgi:hypothetical protein